VSSSLVDRLKVLIDLIEKSFSAFSLDSEIRLLSIASGSAQAVVEALKRSHRRNVKAILVDADSTAINEDRKTIESCGLDDRFSLICNSTGCLEDVCAEFQPHIIEMVGFLDYRPRKQAIQLIDRLADLLIQGGFVPENIRLIYEPFRY